MSRGPFTPPHGEYLTPSPWVSRPVDLQPPLEGETRADVAVVGGGYMGLCAALRLRAAGLDVVLLEQGFCGSGASGRNAGHLTPTIGKDVYTCLRQWGVEKGLALAAFAQQAVAATEARLRELALDCDYAATGNVVAGLHPDHARLLETAATRASAAGLAMRFLDEGEMRARGLPSAFTSGVLEAEGGHLDPGKYVLGLRARALAAGVRLHEGAPVLELKTATGGATLHTPRGAVRADQVVLATNAYVRPDLARTGGRILPLRVTLFRTRALTADERARLDWRGGEGVYTAHEVMESYRITADHRIVGGSKWVDYGDGVREPPTPAAHQLSRYDSLLASRFPEVPALEVEAYWSGWIGATVDHLPIVGHPGGGAVHYAAGCNGHGIALASHIGEALADEVLGKARPDLDLLRRWTPPIPTEALRRLAFRAVAAPLERRDAKIDRQIASGRA